MSNSIAECETNNAETADNEKSGNNSIEKLQIDDEDEKNISVEDILGTQSLLMSDSDDGEGNRSPFKNKISPLKSIKTNKAGQHVDQLLEVEATKDVHAEQVPGVEEQPALEKQKISKLTDSDSETEIQEFTRKSKAGRSILSSEDDDDDDEKRSKQHQKQSKPRKKISALIDSDSEVEQINEEINTNELKKKKQKQHKSKPTMLEDSEEEESKTKKSSSNSKFSKLVDSESESDNDQENNKTTTSDQEQQSEEATKSKKKQAKPMRASAKKALNGMQAIQSEQQRLHREAHISVPYHQPKKYTLQEFLNRRTITKPLVENTSPVSKKVPPKNLKMTQEELEAYAKLMEERAKEATEFFKSESEDEIMNDEEVDNNTEKNPQQDEQSEAQNNLVELTENIQSPIAEPQNDIALDLELNEAAAVKNVSIDNKEANTDAENLFNIEQETSTIAENIIFDDEQPSTSAKSIIITEIVELPKLDLSKLNISPPKPVTPKNNENLKRLIMEKSASVSPAIKGDANMVIDLETGDMYAKKPTGVDTLLQRLMKTREARKAKAAETINILSTENGKLEITKVDINTHEDKHERPKDPKPGAAYIKLKEDLKSIITKKRMEDLKKKKEEENEHEKCMNGEDGDMDLDEDEDEEEEEYEPEHKPKKEIIIDEDENELEMAEYETGELEDEEVQQQEEEAENDEKPKLAEVEELSEASLTEDDNDDDDDEEQENDDEEEDCTAPSQRKNRIIRAFQDDSDDENDLDDFLKTPKTNASDMPTATQMQLSATKLFDVEEKRSASDEENELLDLCSGQFCDTQPQSIGQNQETNELLPIISQIPRTQKTAATDELLELCSGTFETQQPQSTESHTENIEPLFAGYNRGNKILSSDEEQDQPKASMDEATKPRAKKLTKKMKKKKAKLGFSDDEEESEADEAIISENESEVEEHEEQATEDVPETFVEYDSEENEVVVELTKKDRVVRAANFVENEAELSESEWGSADEDEKNLDKYDIELGDEEEFDREKLRVELEQIHARKMLDKDIREVRQIKEMLFEDEELDGVGRQRQFKWRNAESGFSLDDDGNHDANGADGDGSGDEESEHLWRKIRYEREQLLLEKGLKEDGNAPSSLFASPLSASVVNNSITMATTTLGSGGIRKINIITAKKSSVELKKSSPFLISKKPNVLQQQNVRGSFLVRDKETLTKLAGLTKGASAEDGTAGTINVKSIKAKNFVFATLTEEEHENQKRKADDLLNSSNETGINFMKKPRIEPRREKCLIDQLL